MRTPVGTKGAAVVGLLAALLFDASLASAQSCPTIATPPSAVTGVVNTYYPGLGTVAAGAISFNVNMNAATGVGANITAGDMLIVMQMQDADINLNNTVAYGNGSTGSGQTALNSAGRYEYVIARNSINVGSGASVSLQIVGAAVGTNGLLFAYRTAAIPTGNTPANGQRAFQVIKVAKYQNVTVGGVTALDWNGLTGGVVAIDASGTLTVNGTGIDASGAGFRGGPGEQNAGSAGLANTDYRRPSDVLAHGLKGEGIACTLASLTGVGATRGCPTNTNNVINGDRARGGPGNAGGGGNDGNPVANDQNSGGGGGGNGGSGGQGGNSWSSNLAVGGLGGALFPAVVARMALGGGGGAGTRNNTPGVAGASGGGDGGGIVLVRAGAVAGGTGTPTIQANGNGGASADNDGGGGGGAGGTVVVVKQTGTLTALRILARGGKGGDSWITEPPNGTPGARHGPGGGGGGGVYFVSSAPAGTSSVSGGATGVTTTVLDPYGSSGGVGSTNILGNVLITDLPGVVPCISSLRASVAGLRADASGRVEFVTSQQRGTVAFNVYGSTDARLGGALVRLNQAPLAAPVSESMAPIFYRAETARIDFPFLVVEEIERGGHRRLLGPFPVADAQLRGDYERLEAQLATSITREIGSARLALGPRPVAAAGGPLDAERAGLRGAGAVRGLAAGSVSAVKLEVAGAGRVRVAVSDLLPWGFPAGPVDPGRVRLTNFGRGLAYDVETGGAGQPAALLFTSTALSSDYAGNNVYVLSWDGADAPLAAVPLTRSARPLQAGMVRVEKNQYYAAYLPQDADPWVWDLLVSGQPAGPWSFDLPGLTRARLGAVSVRLSVVGGTEGLHSVTAALNGAPFAHADFIGVHTAVLRGQVPFESLRPFGNTLTIEYAGPPDEIAVLYLDALDLGVATDSTAPLTPLRISGYDPALPALDNVRYLIVTHPQFRAQAEAIAALQQARGLSAAVVDVERAYDRYSGGVVEPNAVKALIASRPPRLQAAYVLLVGDDTYDPRDYTGSGGVSFVPSLMAWDSRFGRVPSENRYADLNGDGRPDVAIGRLPVSTVAEADILVQKMAELPALTPSAPLVALDNTGLDDLSFHDQGASIVPFLAQAPRWADIETQGLAAAREALLDGLRTGAGTTSYFGHGGQSSWADEHLLGASDIGALAGSGTQSVVLAWTCNAQWYQNHLERSLGEDLLLVPQGGAAASFGPAGMTSPLLQSALYSRLYRLLAQGLPLGEAVRRAKSEALRADPGVLEAVEGFNLLGDPALRVPGYTHPQSGGR